MQLRQVILSVACFACLIPSAVPLNLLAAQAVASQAKDDIFSIVAQTRAAKNAAISQAASDTASIIAQGIALKGEALKKAVTSIAGAVINGGLSIGSTIAKAGVHMILIKLSEKPTLVNEPSTIVIQKPLLQDTDMDYNQDSSPEVYGPETFKFEKK